MLPIARADATRGTAASIPSVGLSVETPALFDDDEGGRANGDDPAIWVHPSDPASSLIIVTKKDAGLSVYDLAGAELQSITPPAAPGPDDSAGRFNNVDLLRGFERNILYMAQEDVGIWALPLSRRQPRLRLVDKVREFGVPYDRIFNPEEDEYVCAMHPSQDPGYGGKHLSADAEGLTIYYGRGQTGYLLASSQGDSTFAVYQRTGNNAFIGSFKVGSTGDIDGAEHSDGAAVVNVSLGPAFPRGLFVTHDGENTPSVVGPDCETRENTNFKLVPWEDIATVFGRPLIVDTESTSCPGGARWSSGFNLHPAP